MSRREEQIDSIRKLADFLERTPDAPIPYMDTVNVFVETKEELAHAVRAIGGKITKTMYGGWASFSKQIGVISYDINIRREKVCERVVVGQKAVEAVPAHMEDILEWKCNEILN